MVQEEEKGRKSSLSLMRGAKKFSSRSSLEEQNKTFALPLSSSVLLSYPCYLLMGKGRKRRIGSSLVFLMTGVVPQCGSEKVRIVLLWKLRTENFP